ncbi:MAG: hypothetical protein QF817_04585 [Candidatus Poseidoniaceae archaeon]|jgi:hypothetical protein|nr:hypothetical protein [Candidatus Poseidoniaceae archaeon]
MDKGAKSIIGILTLVVLFSGFLALSPLLLLGSNGPIIEEEIVLSKSQIRALATSGALSEDTPIGEGDWKIQSALQMPNGDLWIGGSFNGTLSLGADFINSSGSKDGLIAILSIDGHWLDIKPISGGGIEEVTELQQLDDNTLLVRGRFNEQAQIGDIEINGDGGWGRDAFEAAISIDSSEWISATRIPAELLSSKGGVWCGWK